MILIIQKGDDLIETLHFTILGNPRPKKNNMKYTRLKNGRTVLLQSDTYTQYKDLFLLQIKNKYKGQPIEQTVNIRCIYYRGDNRKTDLVNLQNGTLDLLVEANILKDDNYNIVRSMDGSTVYVDKKNPRTEIYIEFLNNDRKENEKQ